MSRKFWAFLGLLPQSVRAKFLRKQFEVPSSLPSDLILKQAETEDEIKQALRIVYDSYLTLNYIDANDSRLRLTKYQLLPTTVILIAKRKDEVIGTMSIVMDTSLKLPSDASWDLSDLRKNGRQIAEISSLTIKKNEMSRGKLLLPLCKLMYDYCTSLLHLDAIVVSTNSEVEPFYIDLLMFQRISKQAIRPNVSVKGRSSTCCYLNLRTEYAEAQFKKHYELKSEKYNLYKFFVQKNLINIQLPTPQQCIQSYTIRQTLSHSKILEDFPELSKNFTEEDRKVITNLDVSNILSFESQQKANHEIRPRTYRYEIRQKAWCYFSSIDKIIPVTILNLSESGFRVVFHEENVSVEREKSVFVFFTTQEKVIQFYGRIVWANAKDKIGCSVDIKNQEWLNYHNLICEEYINRAC